MTASAQLRNRSATRGGKVVPRDVRPRRPAARIRPLPARPVSAPVSCPARRRLMVPAASTAEKTRSLALRPARVVSLVASVTVVLAVAGGLNWTGTAANPGIPADTAVIQVGAGETVWDVARRVAPRSDQGAVVERIRQLNALGGSAIAPGQQLQVLDGR